MYEEIVFTHELDTYMIPVKQSEIIPKFIESASKVSTVEEFKKRVTMLMKLDEYDYNKSKVFNKAMRVGTKDQKKAL